MRIITLLIALFVSVGLLRSQHCFSCSDAPEGTIFCDDFESGTPLKDRYFEYGDNGGMFVPLKGVGRDSGIGMRVRWQPGQVGAGGFKKSFGKTPDGYIGRHAVTPDTMYDEIYWRIDVRTQPGWQGGGADKLSRAMTLANSNWAQGMIAHIWSSGPGNAYLGMDPASGISPSGELVSTQYNDFSHLRWLGFKRGDIDLFSTSNSGKWYCVVAHAKLNTPGKKDGIFEFWINDSLQAGSYDLNWHGTWNKDQKHLKINAIFIENYWNKGSPVLQERYLDNFVISTKPISCKCGGTLSTAHVSQESKLLVYPNPSYEIVHFKVPREFAVEGYRIELYDPNGVTIKEKKEIRNVHATLYLEGLSTGMYYYRIVSNTGQVRNGKLYVK